MKKNYLFLVCTFFSLIFCNHSFAQIVGTDVFLQGQWLEVGVDQMGAFGTCTSPATYHGHACCSGATCASSGAAMDASYDWGHDGWATGTPCFMGPYTEPGTPQEGWGMEVAGTEYRNWAGYGTFVVCTGSPVGIPGSITGYSNSGGVATGTFTGAVAGLNITQESRVDTFSSWVVVTTKMRNMTLSPITGVYYERTCDPDNTSDWGGGSTTENVIIHQNEDARHDVMVASYSTASSFSPPIVFNQYNSWLSLATKDCRAKCGYLTGTSGVLYPNPGVTPSDLWTSGTGSVTVLNDSASSDVGIWLVFNIGTIGVGDSAVVSYSYVYNGRTGIDSAFPEPQLVVNGVAVPPALFPAPTIDSFSTCTVPGMLSVPVSIINGSDKDWTWSHWSWTPSTGLASTTGVTNTVDITLLSGPTTYTITGTDTSIGSMVDCNVRTMILTIIPCNHAFNNSPCVGDTLKIWNYGDSLGATYAWTGPGGFTSTKQYITIYPATFADSGMYHVIKTVGTIHNPDSTRVIIHPDAVLTLSNNGPLCIGMVDTLQLSVTPFTTGETFSWSGPASFTSNLEFPSIPGFVPADTGFYKVVAVTSFGCKDSAYMDVGAIHQPDPPVITQHKYCQYDPFLPYTIDSASLVPFGYVLWYPSAAGGTGSTTPTGIDMTIPQKTKVYFSQRSGGCESRIDSITIWVVTQPLAPSVSGNTQYCQYIGPITDLSVTPLDSVRWYTVPAGGSGVFVEPLPDVNVAGVYPYYVSQTDSGCESPRAPVTITVHPKPEKPVIIPTPLCQFRTPGPVMATPSGTGDFLLWYGPGVTTASTVAPSPASNIAPDTILYFVTETTIYGCVSDSAVDAEVIKVKPPAPVTRDAAYCQQAIVPLLNGLVDSIGNSHLNWYYNTTALNPTPRPFTDTIPGTYTWYVSQTVPNSPAGCEGDSAAVNVTIIYLPIFGIAASSPNVCQYDSISLSYYGPDLYAPSYLWTLPAGAKTVAGTNLLDSTIIVQFDTANQNNYVHLRASDDSGFCYTDTVIRIKVVAQPTMTAYTQPEICLGDTTQLALSSASSDGGIYTWYIDNIPMGSSPALNTVVSNSNSGGPFQISWVDSGMHVIKVTAVTPEGCKSNPAYDSVSVRHVPDAAFRIVNFDSSLCLEDSVQFAAITSNYNYSYVWSPARYFNNINSPTIYGKMDDAKSTVTLTVTDPYGCRATSSLEIDPGSCCTILFPNAFTPNASINREFRPIYTGYHKFHQFVIVNRWGQMVFNGGNTNVQWDGNYNGVPQDMGIYYYYIKYDCGGRTIEEKGDVTLIR